MNITYKIRIVHFFDKSVYEITEKEGKDGMKNTLRNRILAGVMALAMLIATWMPAESVKAEESTVPAATNTTFATARDLQFNTSIAETVSDSDAKRFYKFSVNEASELNISVKKDHPNSRFELLIHDAMKTQVYRCYKTSLDGKEGFSTDSIYLTGGMYYLEIKVDGIYCPYSFVAAVDSMGESFVETQDNNNDMMHAASTIQLQAAYKGALTQNDDVDYYQFTVPSAGKINLSMTNATNDDIKYTIYDSAANASYIKSVAQNGKTTDSIPLAKGKYYLAVEKGNLYKSVGSYNFSIDYMATKLTAPKIKSVKNTGKKKIKVTWNRVADVDGYELQYSTFKNFKKSVKKKNLSASKSSIVCSKLNKGKIYYVRMRSYVKENGEKKCSSWSNRKTVKIKY